MSEFKPLDVIRNNKTGSVYILSKNLTPMMIYDGVDYYSDFRGSISVFKITNPEMKAASFTKLYNLGDVMEKCNGA